MTTWCGVLRIGGIGDNLITSSVLPGLKARYDRIEVISKEPNHVIFENNPFVDKLTVTPQDDPAMGAVEWQLKIHEKSKEFEAFFNLSHTCEASAVFLTGQTQFWWPDKIRRKLADVSYLSIVHDVCDLPHDFAPGFFPTEEEVTRAWDIKNKVRSARRGPVIAWCLSGTRVDKLYPYTAVAISRLMVELNASIILFGAPTVKDRQIADEVMEAVKVYTGSGDGLHRAISPDPQAVNPPSFAALSEDGKKLVMDGKPIWPIRRVLSLIQVCDVLISPDTGPAWAVAMQDAPKVILLSHASAKNITHGWSNTFTLHADHKRVPCWPCHRLHEDFSTCVKAKNTPDAAACMADIPAHRIVSTVREALNLDGVPGS